MNRTVLLAVLLTACAEPTIAMRADADAASDDAGALAPPDAGPAWLAAGCEPVPFCLSYSGTVPYCPSVHEAFEAEPTPMLGSCERWLRCPRHDSTPCYSCRDWSSSPTRMLAPDDGSDQPACTFELCAPLDGGVQPVCSDAG